MELQPPPRRYPPEHVFAKNHMEYVVSTPDTLKAYYVEALGIDVSFVDKFQPFQLLKALETTLYSKPDDVVTENFLKTQQLWIMHKLLMNIGGLSERMSSLLGKMQTLSPSYPQFSLARQEVVFYAKEKIQRIIYSHVPIQTILDDYVSDLQKFVEANEDLVLEEKRQYMEARCKLIRWFALLVTGPPGYSSQTLFLQTAPLDNLFAAFMQWLNTQQ